MEMAVKELPPTRGAKRYKKLLTVVWIGGTAGITLAASSLLETIIEAPFNPPEMVWRRSTRNVIMIVGWSIMMWIAHRATRHNQAPPEWLVFGLTLLILAAVLV